MNYLTLYNNQTVSVKDIPEHGYDVFLEGNLQLLKNRPERHCVNYFGVKNNREIRIYCCIADDLTHKIYVSSCVLEEGSSIASFTVQNHNFEKFEREIHENFDINFTDHPWLKPYRFANNKYNKDLNVGDYPFYKVESDELHEVGVGPIHAGIIEPGHFRFICNGEQIMHLEIQLGYQHRGIEELFIQKSKLIERVTLVENIAGDTTVGHTTAFSNLYESLCETSTSDALNFSRTLAQELERIAIHTGDLAAICADIAYQLGNAVFGRLRTPIVNFFQEWGGNRLAKGLIRPGKINFPFDEALAKRLLELFKAYESDFNEMVEEFFSLPSVLSRIERTGIVTYDEVLEIGTVGISARMSGLSRDIRLSHPCNLYGNTFIHEPLLKHHGDVFSRVQLRRDEIRQSIEYCKKLLENIPQFHKPENILFVPGEEKFTLSLVEGWRGEICHCAITDGEGNLKTYKIKDPSHHNWMALAQSVRNNEISDFPICNKSFNLSYCGHDL
ncbi:MAG: NADH dehydrogenase subunit [Bacteroidetes bacterium HGW-Bacteroidetes-1]|jgi:Ni,Fe-hydrogenase III large subunit|nr:MAG: NADH dehydrogenase subunit [Bacteroidetes bacterium HGW-Bacteroidetes-1]